MAKRSTSTIGAAGEHYVAAYLSSKGLVVAIPRANSPATDMLVTAEASGRPISIQVKTGTSALYTYKRTPEKNYWLWDTQSPPANLVNESHWYVFVFVNGWPSTDDPKMMPITFFVPSRVVDDYLKREQTGLKRPFFIMTLDEAEQYRGEVGYQKLAAAMSASIACSG